ncbi:unnamed protein product [Urochloa humidicola]
MDTATSVQQRRRWLPWARRQAAAYLAAAGWGDDDGWVASAVSVARVVVCFLAMMVTTAVWAVVMLLLLPWPSERIRQSNVYGHVTGRLLLWILFFCIDWSSSGSWGTQSRWKARSTSTRGESSSATTRRRWTSSSSCGSPPPAPSGSPKNHLVPAVWAALRSANHLRIDRSNPAAAIESMKEVARQVVKNNLSLILFPEGTRSRDGRLLPFKKGFVHAALQTRLPIVPIVVTGTHQAWRNNSVRVRPVPLAVKVLPPVSTDGWEEGRINEYVEMVRSLYVDNLPDSQKPLDALTARKTN